MYADAKEFHSDLQMGEACLDKGLPVVRASDPRNKRHSALGCKKKLTASVERGQVHEAGIGELMKGR